MRVKHIVFLNRAPIGNLDLVLDEKRIVSLTGINGAGKTTILSYIVDAMHEMARNAFKSSFSGEKEHKYYRSSSSLYSVAPKEPSLVFICFEDNGVEIKYIDFLCPNEITEEEYKKATKEIPECISYEMVKRAITGYTNTIKFISVSNKEIRDIFNGAIQTYFPAYRYEQPGYLTDIYEMELRFECKSGISGYLRNPLEITSDLPQIANWIMDLVLDQYLYFDSAVLNQVNQLISLVVQCKTTEPVRIGIGRRHLGGARIQIVENNESGKQVYPSIFNLSSGEASLLCIFAELIKQADRIGKNTEQVEGIVLIDEIDKHLHIRMQKEVLPKLISLFPRIQFIFSTHSGFVNIGIVDSFKGESVIIDLDKGGIECEADKNGVFREAYNAIIDEESNYYTKYEDLKKRIIEDTKPIIITEGKTDWKHLKAAKNALSINDFEFDLYEYNDSFGDSCLKSVLESLCKFPNNRIIIGMFDRDNLKAACKGVGVERFISLGNNVYAFAIPPVNADQYNTEIISIEHYYKKNDLTKCTGDGKRLFLGEEFLESQFSKDGNYFCKQSKVDNKIKINGVIDEKVFDPKKDIKLEHNLALSKNAFADLVLSKSEYSKEFDFSSFASIFDVLREICSHEIE